MTIQAEIQDIMHWRQENMNTSILIVFNLDKTSERISIKGKGFDAPIVGDPVDNERTAIDKRVEFTIIDCVR